jgi:ketosteroid isomerase-like protein
VSGGRSLATALAFVRAINKRNVDAIAALMTPRHLFVDSLGTRFRGRELLREGWRAYFDLVQRAFARPDAGRPGGQQRLA